MQPSDESLFLFLLLVLVAEDDEVFCVSILPLIVALLAISPKIMGQSSNHDNKIEVISFHENRFVL